MDTAMNTALNGKAIYQTAQARLKYCHLKPASSCEYRTYDSIRLIIVLSGTLEYGFDEDDVCHTNTHMMLLPSYSQCHVRAATQTKLMVLEIEDAMVKNVYRSMHITKPFTDAIVHPKPYIQIKLDQPLYTCIQQLHSTFSQHQGDPYLVELDICKLLYMLLQTEYTSYFFSIKASHPMEEVRYYINRNIKKPIQISQLADIAGMNHSNFTSTFRRHFGKTPLDYIHSSKMAYAEELLSQHTVTDVALDLGYENVSSFISQFKKVYHVTPKQFQLCLQ